MIPQAYITEWSQEVPWQSNEQVEQDLVICRALVETLIQSYREYMQFSVDKPPTQREYLLNMDAKMNDPEFLGDTTALLRPDVPYDPQQAYDIVKTKLLERL